MTIAAAFEAASGGALGVTGSDVRPLLVDGKMIDELRVEGVVRATGHPFSISSGFSGVSLDDAAAALGRAALAQNPLAQPIPSLEQQVVTEPAVLDAVADSIAAAAGLRTLARDIREGKLSTTPKLSGLQDAFAKFTTRVEAAAQALIDKMEGTAASTETAVQKFGGAVDSVAATAKAIDDAANQLTNGGPPGPLPGS